MDKNEVAKEILVAAIDKDMFFNEDDRIEAICVAYKEIRNAIYEAEQAELQEIRNKPSY
jgi:hypothetical protein